MALEIEAEAEEEAAAAVEEEEEEAPPLKKKVEKSATWGTMTPADDQDPLVLEAVLEWCCETMGRGGAEAIDEDSFVSEEMFRLWVEDLKMT